MAFSRLQDEGVVAACEASISGPTAQALAAELFQRPAFIQDPSPNTVDNTMILAHCTSSTRLKGIHDADRAPFLLRDYQIRSGVAVQVLWPEEAPVTVIQPWGTGLMVVTGKVVGNIAQPPCGGCCTSIEVRLDTNEDTRNCLGFHQCVMYGNLERPLKMFGKLAGIRVTSMMDRSEHRYQDCSLNLCPEHSHA